jgi:hypothetical protein
VYVRLGKCLVKVSQFEVPETHTFDKHPQGAGSKYLVNEISIAIEEFVGRQYTEALNINQSSQEKSFHLAMKRRTTVSMVTEKIGARTLMTSRTSLASTSESGESGMVEDMICQIDAQAEVWP